MDSILVAMEDDEHRSFVVRLLETNEEWKIRVAHSARECLDSLSTESIDLLLSDARFTGFAPADFLAQLRRRFPALPVVLLTATGPSEALVQALRLGAANYVPRSSIARDLVSTVSRVLALCRRYKPDPELLACRTSTRTTFVLSSDAALFPSVVAYVQDELERFHQCPRSERVNAGIAVEEALLNALVHGSLEIGPEVREQGLEAYERRIAERQREAPYKDRKITLECAFSADEATIRVIDEGPGFDAASVPDPTRVENLGRSSGRGLLLVRSFMDEVSFNDEGNEIRMVKRNRKFSNRR